MSASANGPGGAGTIASLESCLLLCDSYTRTHCGRVARLSCELGADFDVLDEDLEYLRIAAQFHDVGNVAITEDVLKKRGRLNDKEWAQFRAHSEVGERLMRMTVHPGLNTIALVIRHHHEAFDGTGYPDSLAGEAIPLLSRILLIADAYDAMISARPYRPARTHKGAMRVLERNCGTALDPEVFRAFARRIERSPSRGQ